MFNKLPLQVIKTECPAIATVPGKSYLPNLALIYFIGNHEKCLK